MDNCTICHSLLVNKKEFLRARMRDTNGKPLGERFIYQAWCPECEIYLKQSFYAGEESPWTTSNVQPSELNEEISESELQHLGEKMEQLMENDPHGWKKRRWEEFISIKKETDKIYRYTQGLGSDTATGYVIKRGAYLIGQLVYNFQDNND